MTDSVTILPILPCDIEMKNPHWYTYLHSGEPAAGYAEAEMKKKQSMYSVRTMMLIIGLLIPMNLVTLIMSAMAVQGLVSQMKQNTEGTLRVYMSQIDAALTSAATRSTFICQDSIDSIHLASRLPEKQAAKDKDMQAIIRLSNTYRDYLKENSRVAGMFAVYPQQRDQVIADSKYSFSKHRETFQEYLDSRIQDERSLNKWETMTVEDGSMLFYMSRFKNGYYGVWYDLNDLVKALKIENGEELFTFADKTGSILYASQAMQALAGEEETQKLSIEENASGRYERTSVISSTSGLTITRYLSLEKVLNAFPVMLRIMLIMSLLGLFALPIILYYMTRWIIRPVQKLNDAMEQVSQGNMDFRIEEGLRGSEFERMNREFNHMMEDVSRLKIDVYEQQLEKQNIRLKFLSQQIQPHFILNTLNILYSYEKEEFPLIQKMILCLSRYFRYIVNANMDEVPLKAEMEHIRNYFEIQQARYPDTFFSFVEYDEEIANCLVPPLLIQNFAENSIKHSIKIGNHINIFVIAQQYEGNKIRVRMLDTGQGIDQELIDKIAVFQKTGIRQEGLGVGIQNAIERLNVLYGADTSFEISRDQPHGTRVEIVLPLKLGEDDEE